MTDVAPADPSPVAPVPQSEWVWLGHAQHFICSRRCDFRLGTRVGDLVVSTVGDYLLDGMFEDVGSGRAFETCVFRVLPGPGLSCGCPEVDHGDIVWSATANSAREASAAHYRGCQWAATVGVAS